MLNISYEFRKGILFIRLDGKLTQETSDKLKEEITDMIEDNGITNVVFNISRLSSVDEVGIKKLWKNIEICRKNKGKVLFCGGNKFIKNYQQYFNENNLINDERSAFHKIII